MSDYDTWLLMGSGAFSTERETVLAAPCENEGCGSVVGMLFVDDFGSASLECENGHEQTYVDEFEDDPDDYDPGE